ncbi:FG-GAP-like repeat-containing protein [Candidatus Zixiibacteriota bacterium]
MMRKAIVGLMVLVVMTAATVSASQIDNDYVYAISKALFDNYSFAELEQMYERDVMHAAEKLGFDRQLTEAEAIKLRCIIGAIEMPYVSPVLHEGYTPTPTGRPARPEVSVGKVDGSNAFELVWQNDGVADSAEYAISDIATTTYNNDLDNDGLPEIVVTCKKYPTPETVSKVIVFENTGDDTYAQVWYHDFTKDTFVPGPPDTSFIRATRVELGDLDGDGDLDIIVGTRCYVVGKTDFGCVQVFAWDGVNGSDNYGAAPATTYDLGKTGSQWCTAMEVADIVPGGSAHSTAGQDLIVAENVSNYAYLLNITGTLPGAVTWNQVYCDSFSSGSPYAAAAGDCDNDGEMEFYITRWNWVQFHTYEWESVGDTVTHYGYIRLEPVDDYSWEGTKVANLDGDSYSEVYITSTVGDLWVMTNTGDVGAADSNKVHASGIAMFGADVGDQDHGAGSDGGDVYVAAAGGDLFDYEFTGADVTNIGSYTVYNIHQDPNSIANLMVTVGDSLDKDGEHEVVIGNSEAIQNPSLFVIEHGEFALHDVGVQSIAPEWTTVGQSPVEATVKNFGASDETNVAVNWLMSTGASGAENIASLLSQATEDVSIPWTADTTGAVVCSVWTDMAGDENALNDRQITPIYVYPAESMDYSFVYETESPARTRGVGVFGNDDFCVGVKNSPYSIEFYHNAPDSADVIQTYWENPGDPGDHIDLIWNWGIGVDPDLNAYLTNQDSMQSVLVFDYDGNSTTHRLELGVDTGVNYPTACDIDDSGYVYIAFYIGNPTGGDQVVVFDKLANWNDALHTAPLMTSFEPDAYVVEGMCVNGDGSVIWVTNRSAPAFMGDVTRWTGSPTLGYDQDTTFAGDGTLEIPGFVRGVELAPNGDIFICSDSNNEFNLETIIIADGTTGEMKGFIDIDDPGTYHASPYDLDFSFVGQLDLAAEKAGGTDINLSWSLPTATALYVTHQYGWYVAKWEGPGFKGASSYAVHRDTIPNFVAGAGNLVTTTPNSFYLDSGAAGDTGTQYYYIVKATGTPGYTSKSVTAGEHDKSLQNVK